MSRALTSGVASSIASQAVYPAFFVSCAFANETIHVWSGIGSITWNGQTWLGVGSLGGISPIGESSGVEAQGITLTLSGIDSQWLNDCMEHLTTSGKAQVYLALFNSAGAMIADPYPAYVGLMDQPIIDLGAETVTISIAVENRLSDLNRARGGRLTDQDQRQRHPNDQGLLYVSVLQDTFINWHS